MIRACIGASFLAALLVTGTLQARPIRTNTPGTGVFIGSGLLGQVVCDAASRGPSQLTGCSLVADFRYAPATHWVFGVRAPLWIDRELEHLGRSVSERGPGDLEISGKWRFFRKVGPWFDRHAAIEAGVKLPTGESDVDASLPPRLGNRLSTGSGSTDVFVDLVYQQGQRRFVWGGDLLYRRNGAGEGDYRFGDVVKLAFDVEYIAFPREYTKPGKEVFVLLEGALVRRFDDEVRGADPETGGTELLLAPGIQHIITEQMLASLSVEIPVWSDVGRAGLESDWNVLVEIRYAF